MSIELFTDHYFHIGSAHLTSGKPCQDYAISDVYEKMAFAIVSDGCSTGRHTDVGSRMLSLGTASAIRDNWITKHSIDVVKTPLELNMQQKLIMSGMQEALGLIEQDMLATCLYAYISAEGGIIHVQGDGVVAIKCRDGKIRMSNLEWANNMPFYPAYKNGNLQQFIDAYGGDLCKKKLREEVWMIDFDGEDFPYDLNEYSLSRGLSGVTFEINRKELEKIEFIAVFSDGVTQIDGLDWKDAVANFLSFKNTTGAFAKRRMIRGIKDSQKNGKGPFDDISYAVVRVNVIGPEDKENGKDTK